MLKLYASNRELYFVMAAEARRLGIPFGGHTESAGVLSASDAGPAFSTTGWRWSFATITTRAIVASPNASRRRPPPVPPGSVLERNLAFLAAHPDEIQALGMWSTP